MKNKSSIRLGPGAPSLILISVVLSMSVLAVLSLMTARSDLQLSRRSAEAAEMVYRLRESAEERRAVMGRRFAEGGEEAVNAALEEDPLLKDVEREGDRLVWTETDGTRTLFCTVRMDRSMTWTAQRLMTSIGETSAEDLETEAKLALADAILDRQRSLDAMLARCAEGASDWESYMARTAAAMQDEPAAEGVTLADGHFSWVETDGVYRYACTVVIYPLESEIRSDFAGIPVLLGQEEEK